MFYCPRLVLDALSFPGVRKSHCNDSLTEGKKMDMDKHKAMEESYLMLSAVLPTKMQAVPK
jgi:hypothetical protein